MKLNLSLTKGEIDIYLNESTINDDDVEEFNVLQYHRTKFFFNKLSIMTRDMLNIPITVVKLESAFSMVCTYQITSTLP